MLRLNPGVCFSDHPVNDSCVFFRLSVAINNPPIIILSTLAPVFICNVILDTIASTIAFLFSSDNFKSHLSRASLPRTVASSLLNAWVRSCSGVTFHFSFSEAGSAFFNILSMPSSESGVHCFSTFSSTCGVLPPTQIRSIPLLGASPPEPQPASLLAPAFFVACSFEASFLFPFANSDDTSAGTNTPVLSAMCFIVSAICAC